MDWSNLSGQEHLSACSVTSSPPDWRLELHRVRLKATLETSGRLKLPRYESLQPHYNLMERAVFEPELEPLCQTEGLGVILYFSLAASFLTGKYRSEANLAKSPRGAGVKKYLNKRGFRVLGVLDEVAARHAATPGQVALAWLIARPAPIASATSIQQLHDPLRAVRLQLDRSDIDAIDRASA